MFKNNIGGLNAFKNIQLCFVRQNSRNLFRTFISKLLWNNSLLRVGL